MKHPHSFLLNYFIGYSLYLHFKCYLLPPPFSLPFPLPLHLFPWRCSLSQPPSPVQCLGILLHWENVPSLDQSPLLPLMSDNAVLCYICNWSYESLHVCSLAGVLVPGSFGGSDWLMMLFFPWGCKSFQLLQSFVLAPSIGSQCSVRWLAASILICISMALAEPLRRHPYQAPASKHFLAPAIVFGFDSCISLFRSFDLKII